MAKLLSTSSDMEIHNSKESANYERFTSKKDTNQEGVKSNDRI
jgi:hypothetical protein